MICYDIFVWLFIMDTLQRRFLLFLVGCIGVRVMIVLLAFYTKPVYLPMLGYIALLPAIGFLYIYLTGSRKRGMEVGGEKIWWNCLRPLHSLLYFLFAYAAITRNQEAWKFLALDVSIGFTAFIGHHYTAGNLGKLLS